MAFRLCFLYLRNVKGFSWNHKRVYRIYCELELNMRTRPKNPLVREKPEALNVPQAMNETRSMDFMHDQLADGRSYRLSTLSMTTTAKGYALKLICRCHQRE
jgi:putative transposase